MTYAVLHLILYFVLFTRNTEFWYMFLVPFSLTAFLVAQALSLSRPSRSPLFFLLAISTLILILSVVLMAIGSKLADSCNDPDSDDNLGAGLCVLFLWVNVIPLMLVQIIYVCFSISAIRQLRNESFLQTLS